jgi:hypothetical protein
MFTRFFPRLVPLLALLSQIALWVVAATTLGRLEGPYPTQFDVNGQPTAFGEGGFWVLPLVGFALLLTAILVVAGSRRLAVTHPRLVNVPRKRDWMRLPPDRRLATLEPISSLVYGLALFANLLFITVVGDMHAVATGALTEIPQSKALFAIGGIILWIALSMLRMRLTIIEEVRRVRRAELAELSGGQTT